ncbi:MAG: hypothetical protein WAR21_11710 [Candidatus Acidiferrales bacterium]
MFAQSNLLPASIGGISGSDGAVLLACLTLAAATMLFIFYIEPDPADSAPHRTRLDQLLERRDAIYENLRDLKFEHRAGKFSERDFEETRQALETEAATVLAEIEEVTGGPARPARPAQAKSPS